MYVPSSFRPPPSGLARFWNSLGAADVGSRPNVSFDFNESAKASPATLEGVGKFTVPFSLWDCFGYATGKRFHPLKGTYGDGVW